MPQPGMGNYSGVAGEMAVKAEISARGHNVATPSVDVGDDIITINPQNNTIQRVQVKTSFKQEHNIYWSRCQFNFSHASIHTRTVPDVIFVFAMRIADKWHFATMQRAVLQHMIAQGNIGTRAGERWTIAMSVKSDGTELRAGAGQNATDLTNYLDNWGQWPDNYW